MKGYYMYAGGFYIYSIFALVFWETRRSDFAAQMAHHITSVFLILSSYILRYVYIVATIVILVSKLLLNSDFSSIFLLCAYVYIYC